MVWKNIQACRLLNLVICFLFDTTASNTGIVQGKQTKLWISMMLKCPVFLKKLPYERQEITGASCDLCPELEV